MYYEDPTPPFYLSKNINLYISSNKMRAIFTFTAIAFKCQTAANCLFDSDPTHQATGSEVPTSPLTQPD